MIIRKVNALAGAGKTFAAVHYADRNARIGHKYALVQPTQDLIDETVKHIRGLNPAYPVTAIHGGTSDTVIRDIVDHTRTARSHEGDILLMTHAAFQRLPYWHHKDEWHVIVDEIFQADRAFDFNLSATHGLLTRAIKTEEYDPQYARVVPNHADYDYLRDIASLTCTTMISTNYSRSSRPARLRRIGKPSSSTSSTRSSSAATPASGASCSRSPCSTRRSWRASSRPR